MGADFSTSLMLSLVHGPLSPVPRRTEEAEAYDDLGAPLSVLRMQMPAGIRSSKLYQAHPG